MNAKDYLKQYEHAVSIAENLRRYYEEEQEKIDAIGSTLGGEPGMPHGTGISRKTENKAIRLADAQARWKEAEIDALIVRDRVFDLIWDIPGIEGKVLYDRYIDLMTWEKIAEKRSYSYTGIFYVHNRALEIVEKKLSAKEDNHE